MDFSRFLLKKELLLSRFIKYDEQPESYAVWKASFKNITAELKVTPDEEFDLLLKWLGPESSKHAISIRAATMKDPTNGLVRLWARLDERYGSPEMVEAALKVKLSRFPKLSNKDNIKLYELSDVVSEIEATMYDEKYASLLAYYHSSSGVNPIVSKLPYGLQEKWTTQAVKYKDQHNVTYPPFKVFAEFLRTVSRIRNDPSFNYDMTSNVNHSEHDTRSRHLQQRATISTNKTDVSYSPPREIQGIDIAIRCPVHNTRHSLNQCRGFRVKPLEERKELIRTFGICYKCCATNKHPARLCTEAEPCGECGSSRHPTALHTDLLTSRTPVHRTELGGESKEMVDVSHASLVTSTCTQICGKGFHGKSCAKTILVRVYPEGEPGKAKQMYAILDDQSNASLVRSEFFDLLNVQGEEYPYTLLSCAGRTQTRGRRTHGYVVESLDGTSRLKLPTLLECNQIPNHKDEIPTPEIAQCYQHLCDIAGQIHPIDNDADILLLIGRDVTDAHHVLDQRVGPMNSPYAQKLRLGWVIVGESCLGKVHKPDVIHVNKTYILHDGRPSHFEPCSSNLKIKQACINKECGDSLEVSTSQLCAINEEFGVTVFQQTKDDEKLGMSIEDKYFLKIMDDEFHKDPSGNWIAPLPFRTPRQSLPNNKTQAMKRAQILDRSLQRNPAKKRHFQSFMQKVFDSGHAELAPPLTDDEECWYLPIFGVYHPRKPDQIRGVFDSSAQYQSISLNDVLLRGPDMTNSLLGILIRFRKELIAITADIQQMFHCFLVREDHRNYLRFLWYRDNNTNNDLVEYRMCVHVFGNSPSPAVATYGLRRTAYDGQMPLAKT
jgi:hypothetical protein